MINAVHVLGFLDDFDQENELIRYIKITRNYKDNKGIFQDDYIACLSWIKKRKGELYTLQKGSMVAIQGRIESIEGKTLIIVENIVYLGLKG